MPLAPKMETTRSSWTPLNHPPSNSKVFEERRSLLVKWFDRWSDSQRRALLQDLVQRCSGEQLSFLRLSVGTRLPLQAADFTRMLPRALSLYLLSFLDPRSLSRCARVSWSWRSLVELDQLWMPKCVRRGWCISFTPTPLEQGVWKRHYIHTVQELQAQQHFAAPHVLSCRQEVLPEPEALSEERPASSPRPHRGVARGKQPLPWRDSDRHPKDTLRFNYLDNLHPPEQQAVRVQTKTRASTCRRSAWEPQGGSRRALSTASKLKLCKAKSLMLLNSNCSPQHPPLPPPLPPPPPPPPPPPHHHDPLARPSWGAPGHHHPVTMETAVAMLRLTRWNAGVRPAPVRPAVPPPGRCLPFSPGRWAEAHLEELQRQHSRPQ